MRILFITPDLESNSLGRTYALWSLAEQLGDETRVVSLLGERIWGPLSGHAFARVCRRVSDEQELKEHAEWSEVVVAVKPLASSLLAGERVALAAGRPLVVDIDDPDLYATLAPDAPLRRIAKKVLKAKTMREAAMRFRIAKRYPTITSNPTLQEFHGGTVIPHVRQPMADGAAHSSTSPHVVFVGTNRAHKGTQLLREAIAELHPTTGIRLTVTDDAPDDAAPWEDWVGSTGFQEGLDIVGRSDIVALPSLRTPYARGQLPAKLIDAMILGRAIITSDIDPMPWALGGSGIVVKAGDKNQLKDALRRLCDPSLRAPLGASARERALSHFSVEANVEQFETVMRQASGKGVR